MPSRRYPHRMPERDRRMAESRRATARAARSAQRVMLWGLARGSVSIIQSLVVAGITLFVVCIVLAVVGAVLPVLLGAVALIAAVVVVVLLVRRHKQRGEGQAASSQNAPRAAEKNEVRLFASCPSCGTRYQFTFRKGTTETVFRCPACKTGFKVSSSGTVWPIT